VLVHGKFLLSLSVRGHLHLRGSHCGLKYPEVGSVSSTFNSGLRSLAGPLFNYPPVTSSGNGTANLLFNFGGLQLFSLLWRLVNGFNSRRGGR
jgi:hypothetical protein